MNEVINNLNNLLKNNDVTVVACSGGPDSMALLDIINKFKLEKKLTIICAHINHNVRKESILEEKLVEEYCKKNDIVFESMTIKEKIITNFEMEARKIRYNYFEQIIKKYKASYLFTAHHGDDLIETILMRLNRGSILKGYKGIETVTQKSNYKIIRPLLLVTKKDLVEYVENNNIKFAIDKTNDENNHTRNRFRHFVLPFLKEENSKVHLKYKKFSEELKMYDDFVENYINNNYKNIIENASININLIKKEDKLIKIKIIEKLLNNVFDGNLEIITQKHVLQILELIEKNKNNTKISLPNNYVGLVEYNYFKIVQKKDLSQFDFVLSNQLILGNNKLVIIEENCEKSNYVIRLNSEEIKLPLHVRSRKNGDKMFVKNMNGSKKIGDILTDEKINYEIRNNIPIVTDADNNILWIPGVKKSKFDKEKVEKYDIIIKYILNKEENNE